MKTNSPIKAVFWTFLDKFSSQIVSFIIGVVLARLLSPSDFGIIGIVTIFISLSNVFVDAGFSNAIIRKKDNTKEDLSTAFHLNVIIGIFIYVCLYVISPYISIFFDESILIPLIRILGINIVLGSLCIVQNAILTSQLNIRSQTYINLCSQLFSGVIAIFLAYDGYGIYALVVQMVLASFIRTVSFWIYTKWYPSYCFNRSSFRYLFSFGSKLLGANLIGTIFNEIYSILIGKYIGKAELGFYTKASHLNVNITSISTGIIQKIALPLLAKHQNNITKLKNDFRLFMRLLVLIIAPISAFFFFLAEDIIILLWSEKWMPSVPIFRLLIIGTLWSPIGNLSLILMQVINRTGLILKLEFPKKAIYAIIIFISFPFGVIGLAIAQVIINFVAAVINMLPTKRILQYNYIEQWIDISKYIIYAFILGFLVKIPIAFDNRTLNIVSFSMIYVVLYILFLVLIRNAEISYLINKIKNKNQFV